MLTRPSQRRHRRSEAIQLNLVPILDAMVTLIAFLLFSMSFLQLVATDVPFPILRQTPLERPALQLTVTLRPHEIEVWSPVQQNLRYVIPAAADGKPNLGGLAKTLADLKARFPTETQAVLVPHDRASYETLIEVLDTIRLQGPAELFPLVVLGNIAGGGA